MITSPSQITCRLPLINLAVGTLGEESSKYGCRERFRAEVYETGRESGQDISERLKNDVKELIKDTGVRVQ